MPEPAAIQRVGLEVSLKPFAPFNDHEVRRAAQAIIEQWQDLVRQAREVAILLWTADGTELLQWAGDDDEPIAWAHSVGFNNTEWDPYGDHHVTAQRVAAPYRDDVPMLTYGRLRRTVSLIRATVQDALQVPVSLGTAFDPGPEFARSAFKYVEHPEILQHGDGRLGKVIRMVRADSTLDSDNRAYAGFPAGLMAGTSFATLLGRQAQEYVTAMGFDYLWLSNGFGFSSYPWTPLGAGFDGTAFDSAATAEARAGLLRFWEDLLAACQVPIEIRGTNFTAGIDIGSNGTPSAEILRHPRIRNPPPNSPWGPLNREFGLELSGYMSRVAAPDRDGFMFRFYANDPWFWQNPWWDFYRCDPFDIMLPMSVSRIDRDGRTVIATDVQILTVDTEEGVLDPRVGRDVGAHILRARECAPDAPGPLIWVYPWDTYHEDLAIDPTTARHPYAEDWILTAAIDEGLPLSTVIATRDLTEAAAAGTLAGCVLVVPTGALRGEVWTRVVDLVRAGARVLAYGPSARAGADFEEFLGLAPTRALAGTLAVIGPGLPELVLEHSALLSGGGVATIVDGTERGHEVASVSTADGSRASYIVERALGEGLLVWVRGTAPMTGFGRDEHGLLSRLRPSGVARAAPGRCVLAAMERLGCVSRVVRQEPEQPGVVQTVHRSDGAWWFSGYLADSTVQAEWRFPWGMPVLHQRDCSVVDGLARYTFGSSFQHECRVFVDQRDGRLAVRELAPFPYRTHRRFAILGLRDASVVVMVPREHLHGAEVLVGDVAVETRRDQHSSTLRFVASGEVQVRW